MTNMYNMFGKREKMHWLIGEKGQISNKGHHDYLKTNYSITSGHEGYSKTVFNRHILHSPYTIYLYV